METKKSRDQGALQGKVSNSKIDDCGKLETLSDEIREPKKNGITK